MASSVTGPRTSDFEIANVAPYGTDTPRDYNNAPRSAKRRRMSVQPDHHIPTELEMRAADPTLALEVDIMILDYLAYQTTAICLSLADGPYEHWIAQANNSIAMTDAFIKMFRNRHVGTFTADAELQFRLSLLQLVTFVTMRYTYNMSTPPRSKLAALRGDNNHRARLWIGEPERLPSKDVNTTKYETAFPLSASELQNNRISVLHSLGLPVDPPGVDVKEAASDNQQFYGEKHSMALLDVLPAFMRVSAARQAICSGKVDELWMELAGEFMLQACLEQYLIYGASGLDPIDEAFAWGFIPTSAADFVVSEGRQLDDDGDNVYALFCGDASEAESEAESESWKAIKDAFVAKLFPSSVEPGSSTPLPGSSPSNSVQSSVRHAVEAASTEMPFATFQRKLHIFLKALSCSISEPVLVQLEKGQFDGMTAQESRDFLREVCDLSGDVLHGIYGE